MNRFGGDVVFSADDAVLKSYTAAYLTLKNRSKVRLYCCNKSCSDLSVSEKWVKGPPTSLPFKFIQDIGKAQQMYHFGIDEIFGSGNFTVTSKVKVNVTIPRSKVGQPK